MDDAWDRMSAHRLAVLCGVTERQARRWRAARRLPAKYLALLEQRAGELGALDAAWNGWRLFRGELIDRDGNRYRPGDVVAIPLRRQQLQELERRARAGAV
jgi:hypothetical protein